MTDSATEKNATKLLPCPFCGCESIDEYEGDFGNGVYCMNCGAMMGEPIHNEWHVDGRITYEQAVEAWNTRTPVAATLGSEREKQLELLVKQLWYLVNHRSGYGYAAALESIEELGIEVDE